MKLLTSCVTHADLRENTISLVLLFYYDNCSWYVMLLNVVCYIPSYFLIFTLTVGDCLCFDHLCMLLCLDSELCIRIPRYWPYLLDSKLRFSLKGSISKFHSTWDSFLWHLDLMAFPPVLDDDWPVWQVGLSWIISYTPSNSLHILRYPIAFPFHYYPFFFYYLFRCFFFSFSLSQWVGQVGRLGGRGAYSSVLLEFDNTLCVSVILKMFN